MPGLKASPGKYQGGLGWFKDLAPLDLVKPSFRQELISSLESTFATNSWKQLSSVAKKTKSLEVKYNLDLSFPWDLSQALNFTLACHEQKLKPSTIKVYISRVKSLHQMLNQPWHESHWLKLLLRGISNNKNPRTQTRRAMTVDLLRNFKEKLISSKLSLQKKRLVWLASTLLFNGCLRGAEIFCPTESTYSLSETLLSADVVLTKSLINSKSYRILSVTLKNTKESKGPSSCVIELFENNQFYCPVNAYIKFVKLVGLPEPDYPLLQLDNKGLTINCFNKILKNVLGHDAEFLSSHSFRAGLVTSLVRAGASDEMIQATGRWSSQAFQCYMKKTRINRIRDQLTLSRNMAKLSKTWRPGCILVQE